MSLFGFSGAAGCILLPLLSDHIGRKTVVTPSLFILGFAFLFFLFSGANFPGLVISSAVAGFFVAGTGPLVISAFPTESVPPRLAATASGVPLFFGHVIGGTLAPYAAGKACDLYGLKSALYIAALGPLVAGCFAFFYKETAPRALAKRARRANSAS